VRKIENRVLRIEREESIEEKYQLIQAPSYDDSIEFLKWWFAPYKSLIRKVLTLIGIPKDHTRTVSKFEVLTLTGIPKDRTCLRYPNLKFTLKNIQNKKNI